MSESDLRGLMAAILEKPDDPANWLVMADYHQEFREGGYDNDASTAMRRVAALLQSGAACEPLTLLSPLRTALEVADSDYGHAYYLQIAGKLTHNALTRLQGEYLLDYLEGLGQGKTLLNQIARETRKMDGLESTNANQWITGLKGRIYFDFSAESQFETLPKGFHASGDVKCNEHTEFRSVDDGCYIAGRLDLEGCGAFHNIGKGCYVGGLLELQFCDEFRSLPPDIEIRGRIHFPGNFPDEALIAAKCYPGLSKQARIDIDTALTQRLDRWLGSDF